MELTTNKIKTARSTTKKRKESLTTKRTKWRSSISNQRMKRTMNKMVSKSRTDLLRQLRNLKDQIHGRELPLISWWRTVITQMMQNMRR